MAYAVRQPPNVRRDPHGERLAFRRRRTHRIRRRPRLSRNQQIKAVYEIIYKRSVKNRGTSIRYLSARRHRNEATIRSYLREIQRRLRTAPDIRIQMKDSKLYYVNLRVKEQELRKPVTPTIGDVQVVVSVDYGGDDPLYIDAVRIVPNYEPTILQAYHSIKQVVEDHFGKKAMHLMDGYRTLPATPQSYNYFRYKHRPSDRCIEF